MFFHSKSQSIRTPEPGSRTRRRQLTSAGPSLYFLALLCAFAAVAGCGSGAEDSGSGAGGIARAEERNGYYWIEIEGDDQMRFNITRFSVPAGVKLRLLLTITGVMDRESMGHNWVLVDREAPLEIFAADAAGAFETDFIPEGWKDTLLAWTELIGGGERAEIVFQTPEIPGEYPYLCTFPGHFYAGMRGVMVVE